MQHAILARCPYLRLSLRTGCLFGAVALGAASARAGGSGDPAVVRQGSSLTADWTSPAAGTWTLTDAAGAPCAEGATTPGANHIDMEKIAAPSDLVLTLAADGNAPVTVKVPGVRTLSPLPRPAGAAVIYELPPRTYLAADSTSAGTGKLNDLTAARLADLRALGVDYLWLAGVLEHADRSQTDPDAVKGEAGSYYAIYDSWNVAPELGTLDDFDALVGRAHAAGLRVMLDLVANHTARVHRTSVACKAALNFGGEDSTAAAFSPTNNYYYIPGKTFVPPAQPNNPGADGVFDTDPLASGIQLESPARVTGNDIVSPTPQIDDWYETAKLNYGWDLKAKAGHYDPRPRTWDLVLDVAKYWVEHGVDGFRIDFAHPVPVEFWRFFAGTLKAEQPNLFLMAEAYATDHRMGLPTFTYYDLFDAGIDSIYESDLFWAMSGQVQRPGGMRSAVPSASPALAADIVQRGFLFTHFMENHDQLRLASHTFAPLMGDRQSRAELGLAYTAYLALMPGNVLLHGGQELEEDASVFGSYAGDNGRTSIFDYVYQSQTRQWLDGVAPQAINDFRGRYRDLLTLKKLPAFAVAHLAASPSLVDLYPANGTAAQSQWIASYVRYEGAEAYLVVTNSDPQVAHEATVHFTSQAHADTVGALRAMGVADAPTRYLFTEVYSRKGWVPTDPNVSGTGLPGSMLYQPGGVPSGLYLGFVPAATTYVFKVSSL